MRKPRINVHIRPETCRRLDLLAERPGVTKASVVDAALSAFLSPEHDDQRDAAILRRLDRLGRKLETLARDQAIATETLSLFVRYYLTITPPLPEADQRAARALGKERYSFFLRQLGKRLAADKNFAREVSGRITAATTDFFAAVDAGDSDPGADTATDSDGEVDDDSNADDAIGGAGEDARP